MRAFEFFGGVVEVVVPDNLKSAVTHPSYYEPDLNPTYRDLGEHYGVAIIPARPYRARDKAKAEVGVQVVQRWIVAALRKRKFFSLDEVNQAIAELLTRLNQRAFRKREGSRASLFAQLDQPALKPLPATRYQFGQWKTAGVNIDYHIEVERHYYSVPYALVHQQVDVHLTAETLEVLHRGVRVASHVRSYERGKARLGAAGPAGMRAERCRPIDPGILRTRLRERLRPGAPDFPAARARIGDPVRGHRRARV